MSDPSPRDHGGSAQPNTTSTHAATESAPPFLKRRLTRRATVKASPTVNTTPFRPHWRPGQEPGLDPTKEDGGRAQNPGFEESQITVVDYSDDQFVIHNLDNDSFPEFILWPQEEWIKSRWINVNGLSWDIIRAVGQQKKLHKLAIEDLMSMKTLTKIDWYEGYAHMILTLQKLVHLQDDSDDESEGEAYLKENKATASESRLRRILRRIFYGRNWKDEAKEKKFAPDSSGQASNTRTLRRYRGGPNIERIAYMEAHSPLTSAKLAVAAEQVSIFLTDDNTVISFFPTSADDIELPILNRLSTADTILRKGDASVLAQALVNTIIDLAMPITAAYENVIGDLELNILTQPNIKHTSDLYITTTEIEMIRSSVNPILNIVKALRDSQNAVAILGESKSRVKISKDAQPYLRDAEDHIVLITESLDAMRTSCTNMIDLIFNTVSAYQNESIKQLTFVTIIFLPLGFLTAYWAVPFTDLGENRHNQGFFWGIRLPVLLVVVLFLMRDILKWYFARLRQRRTISRSRMTRRKGVSSWDAE